MFVHDLLVDKRYEVVELLGSGGMGEVYLARDGVLNRDVALKLLHKQYANDELFVERFKREAQSAASLSYPNIVSVYDRGRSEDGVYYIAMEYVPGSTLKSRIIDGGPAAAREAIDVGSQVAGALGTAHERGVIHRDVKPQNILLSPTGLVKVADFGVARALSEAAVSGTSLVLGTASYMSPEQAMGEPAVPASDLYSLGIVLYEMLTGGLPYSAETPVAVAMKHVNEPPPSPRETNPDVPEDLDAVVSKLLSKSPRDRYASAAELSEDLARVRDGLPPLALEQKGAAPAPPVVAGPDDETRKMAPPAGAYRRQGDWAGRRRKLLLFGAALLAAMTLLGGMALALSDGLSGGSGDAVGEAAGATEVEVPDLAGTTREEAEEQLDNLGLEAEVRLQESPEEDEGTVLDQSVAAGEMVENGSEITLDVGNGPTTIEAPDLVGKTLAEAEASLAEADLKLGDVTEEPSETVSEGSIVEQNAAAGEPVEPETRVDLTVSIGPSAPQPAGGGGSGKAKGTSSSEQSSPPSQTAPAPAPAPIPASAPAPAPQQQAAPVQPAAAPAPRPVAPAVPYYDDEGGDDDEGEGNSGRGGGRGDDDEGGGEDD